MLKSPGWSRERYRGVECARNGGDDGLVGQRRDDVGGRSVRCTLLTSFAIAPVGQGTTVNSRWKLVPCFVGVFGRANSLSPSDAQAVYSSVPKALPFMRQLGRHEDGQSASTITMAV